MSIQLKILNIQPIIFIITIEMTVYTLIISIINFSNLVGG